MTITNIYLSDLYRSYLILVEKNDYQQTKELFLDTIAPNRNKNNIINFMAGFDKLSLIQNQEEEYNLLSLCQNACDNIKKNLPEAIDNVIFSIIAHIRILQSHTPSEKIAIFNILVSLNDFRVVFNKDFLSVDSLYLLATVLNTNKVNIENYSNNELLLSHWQDVSAYLEHLDISCIDFFIKEKCTNENLYATALALIINKCINAPDNKNFTTTHSILKSINTVKDKTSLLLSFELTSLCVLKPTCYREKLFKNLFGFLIDNDTQYSRLALILFVKLIITDSALILINSKSKNENIYTSTNKLISYLQPLLSKIPRNNSKYVISLINSYWMEYIKESENFNFFENKENYCLKICLPNALKSINTYLEIIDHLKSIKENMSPLQNFLKKELIPILLASYLVKKLFESKENGDHTAHILTSAILLAISVSSIYCAMKYMQNTVVANRNRLQM